MNKQNNETVTTNNQSTDSGLVEKQVRRLPDWFGMNKTIESFDEEDKKWHKTKVIYTDFVKDEILLEDIDEKSDWNGLQWKTNTEEINDKKLYRQYA